MKEAIKNKVVRHGENVIKLFNLGEDVNPLQLCRKLRRLEAEAHALMVKECNGELNKTEEEVLFMENEILNKLDKLLNYKEQNIPVFLNGDPRGYALKISDKWLREQGEKYIYFYRDMGGYGIIAPDLSEV